MQKYIFYYLLEKYPYIIDHIIPLYEVLSGQLLLLNTTDFDNNKIVENYLNQKKYKYNEIIINDLNNILQHKNNILICCQILPPTICKKFHNIINIRHGISDKVYYLRFTAKENEI